MTRKSLLAVRDRHAGHADRLVISLAVALIEPHLKMIARVSIALVLLWGTAVAAEPAPQLVEGFAKVEFHHDANRSKPSLDFRGMAVGYMTAGWWAPGQMEKNLVSWQTAPVPEKKATTFTFIGASSVVPSEFAHGPSAKLSINGKYALTFRLGFTRSFTWEEGGYALQYLSKRVEYPYFNSHRQLTLNGNSGIYRLTVPAAAVEAAQPVTIEVELLPFAGWHNGWFMVKHRTNTLQQSSAILSGEVETLRQDQAVIAQQTQMLATQVYARTLGREQLVHEVVYQNGFRHLHPADMIKLQNGELLVMFREGTEHYANDGDVVMLRSKDEGKTWVCRGGSWLDSGSSCTAAVQDYLTPEYRSVNMGFRLARVLSGE